MSTLLATDKKRRFPCPLCGDPLDIRESKKGKPYVVCNGCGVQLFVRNEAGIQRFEKLIAQASELGIWDRIVELRNRYEKKCPECGKKFWVTEDSIATSWLDGSFSGFRCPEEGCKGIVKPEVG
jgi:DNA-directed RNA polymerase subunit RPC12/RpoP